MTRHRVGARSNALQKTAEVDAPSNPGSLVSQGAALPDVGFVRLPQILAVYPVGRSTWWAGVKAGRFPRPVKLGPRISAWRVEDIRGLLANG
jgi:predicted DNA-binding transcriptional regulator AlpA